MLIDIDTRKMDFKKDDMLIFDGEKMIIISKNDLLKDLRNEIKLLKQTNESQDIIIKNFEDKMVKFLKIVGGIKE